jgi:formyl-CoA transferase
LVSTFEHKKAGRYRGTARPVRLSASPAPEPFAAPVLGEHTAEVLSRWGYSAAELEELRTIGVISQ